MTADNHVRKKTKRGTGLTNMSLIACIVNLERGDKTRVNASRKMLSQSDTGICSRCILHNKTEFKTKFFVVLEKKKSSFSVFLLLFKGVEEEGERKKVREKEIGLHKTGRETSK